MANICALMFNCKKLNSHKDLIIYEEEIQKVFALNNENENYESKYKELLGKRAKKDSVIYMKKCVIS